MRIQGDDPQVYLPSSLVEVGKEWSKVWTTTASELTIVLAPYVCESIVQILLIAGNSLELVKLQRRS